MMARDCLDNALFKTERPCQFGGALRVIEFVAAAFQAGNDRVDVQCAFKEVEVILKFARHGRHHGVVEQAGGESFFDEVGSKLLRDHFAGPSGPFEMRPNPKLRGKFTDAVLQESGQCQAIKSCRPEARKGHYGRIDLDAGIKPGAIREF